jgi:hypothetical protein
LSGQKKKKRNTKTPSLGVKIIFLKVPFVIAAALLSEFLSPLAVSACRNTKIGKQT